MTFSDIPGKFTCPFCGGEKYVMALASGNTFSGEVWSDSRHFYPMLPNYSPIQKCPHCSHYFFEDDGHFEMASTVAVNGKQVKVEWPSRFAWRRDKDEEITKTPEMIEMEELRKRIHEQVRKNRFGDLSYQELAEAEKDVMVEGISDDQRREYLITFLYALNDSKYGRARSGKEYISDYYQARFRTVALALIDLFGEEKTITAELWRELGDFDKSIELCHSLITAGTDVQVVMQIMERAKAKDPDAFILHFDKEG